MKAAIGVIMSIITCKMYVYITQQQCLFCHIVSKAHIFEEWEFQGAFRENEKGESCQILMKRIVVFLSQKEKNF
jgi:hypothetical protein